MAAREDQFENHGVHTVLSQLDTALQKKVAKDLSDEGVDNLDRIRQATAFIRCRLEVASPVLTTTNRLDQIQKSIQACLNEINQFQNNGNQGHLANASNQIDAGLNHASAVISLEQPDPTVKAEDAASFKSLAQEIIDSLREKADAVAEWVGDIENNVQELDKRYEEQKAKLNSLQSNLESKLQELESQFGSEQTERETQFNSFMEKNQQTADEKLSLMSQSADDKLSELAEKQGEAEKIVSLIGNIGLTGNFKGAATREKKSADRLRIIALGCFLGMVGVVLATLFVSVENGFDPWLALFRLGAALSLVVPAAYAARESSQHRTLENKNRRAELELASIDAYLESLPDEKRSEIKAELTDKFFGQITEEEKTESGVTTDSLASLLKEAINALGRK